MSLYTMLVRPIGCTGLDECTRSRDDRYGTKKPVTHSSRYVHGPMPMTTTNIIAVYSSGAESVARICLMRIVCCLLFCCWRTVPSTAGAVALLNHTQQYAEEAAGREVMMIQVRQPGFCTLKSMKTNLVPGKADGEIRTAGSNKHNEPQQYCAYWCVAHARRMGGSVGTMGSVIVCCVPRERKTDTYTWTTIYRYVRTK